jgi:hypothetical protein
MLGDRRFDCVRTKNMVVLDGMAAGDAHLRAANRDKHLATAFELGRGF